MPIAVHKSEWDRIRGWTDTSREEAEAVRRRDYLKYLDETSRAMTMEWPNSLENVNKRNEEIRRARREMGEQVNSRFYKRYMKRKDAEQKQLMYSARDTIFKNKDAPKLLRSAVIESVILKERDLQVDFKKERQKEKDQEKREHDDDIIRKAKEWEQMKEEQKRKRFEENLRMAQEVAEQAKEIAEKEKQEHEAELKMQMIDNIRADEEMKAIEKFEEDMRQANRERIFQRGEQSRKECEERKREQAARDKMDDDLIAVLNKSKARIEERRKATEKEIRDEKLRVLEAITKNLAKINAKKSSFEEKSLNKALAEREAVEEARNQADLAKKEKDKNDKIEERKKFLERREQELKDLDTIKQWEMMNKFKNDEIYEAWKAEQKAIKDRKVAQFREDVLKQWHETDARKALELDETRKFYGEDTMKRMRLEDNKLLTYAAALLREAEVNNRPSRPIKKAIEIYCKMNRLYEPTPLYKPLKKVFPHYTTRDLSKPDPTYVEPPPPPPIPSRDGPDEEDVPTNLKRRDGIVDTGGIQLGPKAPREENVSDFARAAPANGLQRPPRGLDKTLDKCPDPQCRCRLSFRR